MVKHLPLCFRVCYEHRYSAIRPPKVCSESDRVPGPPGWSIAENAPSATHPNSLPYFHISLVCHHCISNICGPGFDSRRIPRGGSHRFSYPWRIVGQNLSSCPPGAKQSIVFPCPCSDGYKSMATRDYIISWPSSWSDN